MNPDHPSDHDHDLRESFAHQRRSDHELAPAWNPDLLHVPARKEGRRFRLWLPITATAAAACVLVSLVWLKEEPKTAASTDLAEVLPEFFAPQGEPLFASLDTAPSAMPSDSLLPSYLNIQLP